MSARVRIAVTVPKPNPKTRCLAYISRFDCRNSFSGQNGGGLDAIQMCQVAKRGGARDLGVGRSQSGQEFLSSIWSKTLPGPKCAKSAYFTGAFEESGIFDQTRPLLAKIAKVPILPGAFDDFPILSGRRKVPVFRKLGSDPSIAIPPEKIGL